MSKVNALHQAFCVSIYRWISLAVAMAISTFAFSQQTDSLLKKNITLHLQAGTVFQALNQISESAGCFFIYDSKDVRSEKKIQALKFENQPLREVLLKIIADPLIELRVIDKHILIFKNTRNLVAQSDESLDSTGFILVGGKVYDKESLNPIPFATISIEKLGLGTISNYDGVFNLRIPKYFKKSNVVVSHLGYESLIVPVEVLEGNIFDLFVQPRYIPIQEVFIRNIDAKGIVKSTIENKSKNYCDENIYLTSFYREGVKRNNLYLGYTEAVFKIFKSSYDKGTEFDQVRLLKSRKIELSDRKDTLVVKLKAGIKGALDLDIIKSLPDFLDPELMDSYIYTKTDIVAYDSRSAYAISFEQRPNITQPLFSGTLYIDVESLTLLSADFCINPKLVGKSANLFVLKKDRKINVSPEEIKYSVKYSKWNGKYYIHHVRGDLSFKVRERRRIFSNTFSLFLEYVNIQIDTLNVQRFSRREILKTNTVFSEGNYIYDYDFWGDLNTISPEEDINNAISKINPKIESIESE